MKTIKCKNCGKDITFTDDLHEVKCESCGAINIVKEDLDEKEASYLKALDLIKEEKYYNATEILSKIKDYKDSKDRVEECKVAIYGFIYDNAINQEKEEKYSEAFKSFSSIKDYKDSKNHIDTISKELEKLKIYESNISILNSITSKTNYTMNDVKAPLQELKKLGDFKDSIALVKSYEDKFKDIKAHENQITKTLLISLSCVIFVFILYFIFIHPLFAIKYTKINDNAYQVTNYTGNKKEVIIPEKHNSLPVTEIKAEAFKGHSKITSIVVPDSVTKIGSSAFNGCSSLEEITLPFIGSARGNSGSSEALFGYIFGSESYNNSMENNQMNTYGKIKYYIPMSLKSVTITDEKVIGYGAFNECSNLSSIKVNDTVIRIEDYAFYNCYNLLSFNVPSSVTSIGDYAFYNCSVIESIVLNDSLLSIGDYAFSNCLKLSSITIPDSLISIGEDAFSCCPTQLFDNSYDGLVYVGNYLLEVKNKELETYNLKPTTSAIASYAFSNCSNLKSIVIPNSVVCIGNYAFNNCENLKSVTLSSSLKILGEGTFKYCLNLSSITLPSTLEEIKDYTFYYCSSLTSMVIPDLVTVIGDSAFDTCSKLESITTPNNLRSIGSFAFNGCLILKSIYLPNTVTMIKDNAFQLCSKLTIYSEAPSLPTEWSEYWNISNCTVVWGSTK